MCTAAVQPPVLSERPRLAGHHAFRQTAQCARGAVRVLRSTLNLVQNPSSEHLGTTVWDASIVLAKWMEKVGAPE